MGGNEKALRCIDVRGRRLTLLASSQYIRGEDESDKGIDRYTFEKSDDKYMIIRGGNREAAQHDK